MYFWTGIYSAALERRGQISVFSHPWLVCVTWSRDALSKCWRHQLLGSYIHRVPKKLSRFVFVRTSSNFHQFWQCLAERWQTI